ncbi:MAG: hypothetical protein ACI31R_04845 [Bacilli bacterium]
MKNVLNKDNFMKLNLLMKSLCIFGFAFIIIGIVFVILSFNREILDDKYIIKKVTEYTSSNNKKLANGEMNALKDIEYIGNGSYKVTYTNYAKKNSNKNLIEDGSCFYITDMLGKGYELSSTKIKINNKDYKLEDNIISSNEGINISYENNVINIEIPNTLLFTKNTIEVYIKLVERDVNTKYYTSQEAYYSFIPSIDNDFYNKKTMQSYVIDGFGYIELEEK